MAGSFGHVTSDDDTKFIGTHLLENMGDMKEAVDEMAFMLLKIRQVWGGERLIKWANEEYYVCARGEKPWPDWWQPRED